MESGKRQKALARERALVILKVRSAVLTAKEGAQRLGVSRKTYYEWEQRALGAMALALENQPVGRPPMLVDEEKEDLRRQIEELEKKLFLAEKAIEVRDLLSAYDERGGSGVKKNRKTGKQNDKRG
jgi:transposase